MTQPAYLTDPYRGGREFEMDYVRATPKALAEYRKFIEGGAEVKESDLCVWLKSNKCRRTSDGSPYFVVIWEHIRFVLCVAHGHDAKAETPTVFTLVNVQEAYQK